MQQLAVAISHGPATAVLQERLQLWRAASSTSIVSLPVSHRMAHSASVILAAIGFRHLPGCPPGQELSARLRRAAPSMPHRTCQSRLPGAMFRSKPAVCQETDCNQRSAPCCPELRTPLRSAAPFARRPRKFKVRQQHAQRAGAVRVQLSCIWLITQASAESLSATLAGPTTSKS